MTWHALDNYGAVKGAVWAVVNTVMNLFVLLHGGICCLAREVSYFREGLLLGVIVCLCVGRLFVCVCVCVCVCVK